MDLQLLEKFYKGECTVEEAAVVRRWFASKSEKEKVLDFLQTYWQDFEDISAVPAGHHPISLLNQIHARIREETASNPTVKPAIPFYSSTNSLYYLRVAAILLFAFGLAFLSLNVGNHTVSEELVLVQKEVPAGQKQTLMLADGTKVTVNADTKFTYPEQFASDSREVKLEGEAFFEVARDENKPFIILTKDIHTTVLGTSFNIKAYQDESDISVSVASGKVKVNRVGDAADTYYLTPGREAVYQLDKQSFEVRDFDKQAALAWKDGILYFKDASFEEVKSTLERRYGVEIHWVGNNTQSWQYSGIFDNQSLENVLLSISYVKHFSYALQGKQVKIKFNDI